MSSQKKTLPQGNSKVKKYRYRNIAIIAIIGASALGIYLGFFSKSETKNNQNNISSSQTIAAIKENGGVSDLKDTNFAQDNIKVELNGKQLALDVAPYIKEGRTLAPFRKILEALGAQITWDGSNQTILAKKGPTEIYLKIGENYAFVNGEKTNLDVPPEIINGRTFVPLRFISENLGADVSWNESDKTISIIYIDKNYKIGQIGTYKDITFTIDKVDSGSARGQLKITDKVSQKIIGMQIEVSDDIGYTIPTNVNIKYKHL